jgi:hypothetical protein
MRTIVFRDGTRTVPDHVDDMITASGIETWQYTYQQAMDLANQALLKEHLAKIQRDIIREHFRGMP